ncbi:hypothetical protein KJZ61_01910 [Candidatus Dependentiae bacterium]|nr:hypothetical protein [Candidatus Dependentiae bacterium]
MKFLRFIILLTTLFIEYHISCAKDTAAYYLHPDDLMPLVHGEFKGTLLWLWDACWCQHPIMTSLCVVTATTFTVYLIAPLITKMKTWQKCQRGVDRNDVWRVRYIQLVRDCWVKKSVKLEGAT